MMSALITNAYLRKNVDRSGANLTVASQQTRISYLWYGVNESSRNHDVGPRGSLGVGKAALN